MRKSVLVIVLALAMIAAFVGPAAMEGRASVGVKVGDYWKYSVGGDVEGMSVDVTEKLKVTGIEGSGSSAVFVLALTGSGDVSGNIEGMSISGSVDVTGEIKRLTSNFSIVSSSMEMAMHVSAQGQSATMTMGFDMTYSPAFDDFVGDNGLGPGDTLVSRSNVTTTLSLDMEVMGQHQTNSDTSAYMAVLTMHIGASNESVSVKAGKFDCYVCSYSLVMGGVTESMTYYYSAEAGNYVRMSGNPTRMLGGFGTGDLEAFSFGGRGTSSSILSGMNLIIILVVAVLVIVVVSIVMLTRRRGRTMQSMQAPPPEFNMPQPPPPMAPPPTGPGPGT